MAIVFTEKSCSVCHKISWDSQTGGYDETHEVKGKTVKCDTNGEKRDYDENNERVY